MNEFKLWLNKNKILQRNLLLIQQNINKNFKKEYLKRLINKYKLRMKKY